jgi:1-acyl-sn-glycerol-3-phosphate acyltransferase
MLSYLARGIFSALLIGNLLWAVALGKIINCFPLDKATKNGYSLQLASLAFWLSITFCPWIRYTCSGDAAAAWKSVLDQQAASGRPIMLIGNHVSFMDTLFVSSRFPLHAGFRFKTYMKKALMDLPVLGPLSKNCGHFCVPYVSQEAFSVHHDKMDDVDQEVDEHVAAGGWMCFFPEGQLNNNPETIQSIRHGGMKRAIKYDAMLISLAYVGHEDTWPKKAAVGGFASRVQWSLKEMAPEGTKAFLEKQVKKRKSSDMPDYEVLADEVKQFLQRQIDELAVDRNGNGQKKNA